jgi:hypothetical protein
VLIAAPNETLVPASEKIMEPFLGELSFIQSSPYFLEATTKGINKASSLQSICNLLKIKPEEVMAFGDGNNDIDMLKHVGVGVAMGNANDLVKAASDFVTDTINDDGIFKALKISEFSKIPFLFIGNPGTGKTTTVEMFCKIRGYELVLLRGSQSSPEEILGFDVNSRSEDKFTDKKFPSWYRDVKNIYNNGGKVLLFLDEITGANEYTQSALLNLIFDRKVSTEKLPDDLLIVAAGNYADNLSTQFNLLPPLMSRFCVFNVVPTLDDIDAFLSEFRGGLLGKSNSEDKLKRLDLMELKKRDSGKKVQLRSG